MLDAASGSAGWVHQLVSDFAVLTSLQGLLALLARGPPLEQEHVGQWFSGFRTHQGLEGLSKYIFPGYTVKVSKSVSLGLGFPGDATISDLEPLNQDTAFGTWLYWNFCGIFFLHPRDADLIGTECGLGIENAMSFIRVSIAQHKLRLF